MNLDDFIITCFCWIDDMLPTITKGQKLRQAGPPPKMSDSEVITIEIIGSYLGMSQDQELFESFRRHYSHFFPTLLSMDRTTFVRQAANLWAIKERLWMAWRDGLIRHDERVGIIDSMPLPVCRFARARLLCALSRTSQLWQRSCGPPDLLRLSLASAFGLARRHHPCLPGSGEPWRMERSHRSCWRAPLVWCWAIATTGCPTCKPVCARKGFSCRRLSAKRTRRRQKRTRVRCWDRSAIGLILS